MYIVTSCFYRAVPVLRSELVIIGERLLLNIVYQDGLNVSLSAAALEVSSRLMAMFVATGVLRIVGIKDVANPMARIRNFMIKAEVMDDEWGRDVMDKLNWED